jgi:putative ABC transport system permease protein
LDRVAATLEADYTDDNANIGVGLTSVRDYLAGDLRPTLWLLLAAVGALLLIAAANVAGLLVARAASRQHEVALRVALGATPLRLVAQFLTESTLLAIVGGTVGVLLASALTDSLAALSPADLGSGGAVHVNGQVLLFSLAISLATGLAFGLAPSRQLLRLSVHDDLKQSGRVGGNGAPRRLRTILVATEIALSLALLVTAGLTITSLIKLQRESPGFDPNGAHGGSGARQCEVPHTRDQAGSLESNGLGAPAHSRSSSRRRVEPVADGSRQQPKGADDSWPCP